MKNFIVVVLMSFYSMPLLGAETNTKQSMFASQKECEDALKSGDFAYYQPTDTSRKNKEPIDNKLVFPVKLEADQCRLQRTVQGERWVVQAGNTLMRARKNAAGEFVIFARDDCGNEDLTPIPAPVVAPAPEPVTVTPTTATAEPAKQLTGLPPTSVINNITNNYAEHDVMPATTSSAKKEDVNNQDRYHGWCGFWTNTGCTIGAIVLVAGGTAGVVLSQKDGDPPTSHTGGAFIREAPPIQISIIPSRDGKKGGIYLGFSRSF